MFFLIKGSKFKKPRYALFGCHLRKIIRRPAMNFQFFSQLIFSTNLPRNSKAMHSLWTGTCFGFSYCSFEFILVNRKPSQGKMTWTWRPSSSLVFSWNSGSPVLRWPDAEILWDSTKPLQIDFRAFPQIYPKVPVSAAAYATATTRNDLWFP